MAFEAPTRGWEHWMLDREHSETVEHIFNAVLDSSLTDRALQAIAEYVGVATATYLLVNKLSGQVSTVARWGSFTGIRADYLTYYAKIDPFRPLQEQAVLGNLLRLSEHLPPAMLRHDEWYNDYILKNGSCDFIGGKFAETLSHAVIVGLHCATDDNGPFPRNPQALEGLISPLHSAARLNLGLIEAGYRTPIGFGRLADLDAGAIFTDAGGRVIEANRIGEQILRTGDALTIHEGQICARRNFETSKLTSLIANATAPGKARSAGCMLVARDGGRPALIVRVAPVGAGHARGDMPLALILVSTPREMLVSESELAELYGLSPAESRLALALVRGRRMKEIVADFGVQITTLRTQLSAVLKKCDVERQSDLVRLIANIPVIHPQSIEAAEAVLPVHHASAK